MPARAAKIVALLTATVVVAGLFLAARDARTGARGGTPPAAPVSAFDLREIEIAFYMDRAARDTLSAADRGRLAALYLERARETGNPADLERAESAARASLRLREAHNSGTAALLASILMSQHRFGDALAAARLADARDPGVPGYRALIGEIVMELGDYARAAAIFDSLRREPLSDAAQLRLARWYEVSGRPALAKITLDRVLLAWERSSAVPPSQLGWIRLRLAELALKEGQADSAQVHLRSALARAPDDYRLLGAMARLSAHRGDWRSAVEWGERSFAGALDPATIGVVADAHRTLGDSALAEEYEATLRTLALAQGAFPHRAWSLHLLDRGRDVEQVLEQARRELRTRKDVYGYDVYAWALHKAGRHREAAEAMRLATRLGTRDPLLERHAAAIAAAQANVN